MKNRVLLIEDDAITVQIVTMLLKKLPFAFHVDIAENPGQAIEYFSRLKELNDPLIFPDMILLDIYFPGMDGFAFLDIYQERFESFFGIEDIYILTSSVNPIDQLRARQYPFIRKFLAKPLTVAILENISERKYYHD
jgi:CheY-like chemotaxis protein